MSERVDKMCFNCIHSNGDFDFCFCLFKGSVDAHGKCRKYKLDLLKIEPAPPVNINTEDLQIEQI